MQNGETADKEPVSVELKEGRTYFWCTCGKSSKQPFCDGAHSGTGFAPLQFKADATGVRWLCQCKQTGNSPFCDGSHNTLD